MSLIRLYAYAVSPQKRIKKEERASPVGGAIARPGKQLQAAIDEAIASARADGVDAVHFIVDPNTRTCPVRDAVMSFAHGNGPQAKSSADELARRLSASMDKRSDPALLIAAAIDGGNGSRDTFLWIFPRDEAFRFRPGTKGVPSIDFLNEVFSKNSKLRKAAIFLGANNRSGFLTGKVYDAQARWRSRGAADFWVTTFLECQQAIKAQSGTRMLADALKAAHKKAKTPAARAQLYSAMTGVLTSPTTRWSLDSFAKHYLNDEALDIFNEVTSSHNAHNTTFTFHKDTYEKRIGIRVFHLDSGVVVHSPFDQVGETVKLSGKEMNKLTCTGTIVGERVKAGHATTK